MIEEALHPGTRAMLAYARSFAQGAKPTSLPPQERDAADRLFLLEHRAGRMRLNAFAGKLSDLFGGDALVERLSPTERSLLAAFVDCVLAADEPGVLQAQAQTPSGVLLGLEITLAPLRADLAGPGRVLGYLQPLGGEPFLDGPLARVRLMSLAPPKPKPERSLRLIVSND